MPTYPPKHNKRERRTPNATQQLKITNGRHSAHDGNKQRTETSREARETAGATPLRTPRRTKSDDTNSDSLLSQGIGNAGRQRPGRSSRPDPIAEASFTQTRSTHSQISIRSRPNNERSKETSYEAYQPKRRLPITPYKPACQAHRRHNRRVRLHARTPWLCTRSID